MLWQKISKQKIDDKMDSSCSRQAVLSEDGVDEIGNHAVVGFMSRC